MTAHAIKGYEEKCLEAGMDDYITKPIDPKVLNDSIERYFVPSSTIVQKAAGEQSFDRKGLLERMGGDEGQVRLLIETFLEHAPAQIEELGRTFASGDLEKTREQAHGFKGTAANFNAYGLQRIALDIETLDADEISRAAHPGALRVVEPDDYRFDGALEPGRLSARCGAAARAVSALTITSPSRHRAERSSRKLKTSVGSSWLRYRRFNS